MNITAFDLAQRFTGVKEFSEAGKDNPFIMSFLTLDNDWPENDEVAWCSGFVNYVCWLLRLPRSKDLRARSWLQVGQCITLDQAEVGYDVVILKRGSGDQPGPEVIDAPGHVGFFAGIEGDRVLLCGGNQSNSVNTAGYHKSRVLGVRRLYTGY